MTEMDYDNAILAYEKAIGINPKGKEGYLGLADAYIGLTDYAKALKVLKEGYNETQDEEIREKMKEVKQMIKDENPEENQNPKGAASSNNPVPEPEPEPVVEVDYSIYESIVDAINYGHRHSFESIVDVDKYQINYELRYGESDLSIWGYVQTDIDGDGIDELIIGQNGDIVCDIYSIKDGELIVPIGGGGYRVNYYLVDGGYIKTIATGGASYTTWTLSKYSNGTVTEIETLYTEADVNNYDLLHWFYSGSGDQNAREISEDEAKGYLNNIEGKKVLKLDLKPFDNSEYYFK